MTRLVDRDEAARLLAAGAVVAVPTDTVYGVAASLAFPAAVTSLFALKRRPGSVPLPVLVNSLDQIDRLAVAWPDAARRLSHAFWPGPLTIIVPGAEDLAAMLGSADGSVGFRHPDDAVVDALIAVCGPLAVTSANSHGETACTSALGVLEVFSGRGELAGVLDDGPRAREVSTVVVLSESPWRIAREGAITRAALSDVLG